MPRNTELTARDLIERLQELPEDTRIIFAEYNADWGHKTVRTVDGVTDEGSIILSENAHTYFYDPDDD